MGCSAATHVTSLYATLVTRLCVCVRCAAPRRSQYIKDRLIRALDGIPQRDTAWCAAHMR